MGKALFMISEKRHPDVGIYWNNLIHAFIAIILLAFLFSIWSGKYFLTGDGPTHLYNARILADWLQGKYLDFYQQIYQLNLKPDPNWTGHALLSCLMLIFPPALAQKLLLSGYILAFGSAIFRLTKLIHKENVFLCLLGLPFIFHFSFYKGFWNCSNETNRILYFP